MKKKIKQTRLQKELAALTAPYAEHWATWIKCKSCFLTEHEVRIIERIKNYGKLSLVENELFGPSRRIISQYQFITKKLRAYHKYYLVWVEHCETNKKNEFLDTFFVSRYYSHALGLLLRVYGVNIREVLENYSETELLKKRWLGKKRIAELKNVLAENGCEDLFRP